MYIAVPTFLSHNFARPELSKNAPTVVSQFEFSD